MKQDAGCLMRAIGFQEFDRRIPRREAPVIISENLQRAPFARQNKLGQAIAIQVAPHRGADQSDLRQCPAVRRVELKSLSIETIQP